MTDKRPSQYDIEMEPEDGEWTEEDVEEFMRNMENQQQMNRQQPQNQSVGVQLTGLVLFSLVIYGAYVGHLMNFTIWVTAMLVVLALGNKAIR